MSQNHIIKELKQNGISVLPILIDVHRFVNYFSYCPVYENHVRQGKEEKGPLGSHPWMCHDFHDVIQAPDWFEIALAYTPLAGIYLNINPILYSLNVFYTEPGAEPKGDIQDWHRDSDDFDFLALFLYCTDVLNEDDGPHQYKIGSHVSGDGPIKNVYGKRGTIFFTASKGLHRGLVPKSGRRMIAWARWGVSEIPEAYKWDKLSPLPKENLGDRYPVYPLSLQKQIRLVVA